MKKIFLIIMLLFISSCSATRDFSYGLKQIEDANSKYNTTMETYPNDIKSIDLMTNDLNGLKNIKLGKDQEQFNFIINYRLLNLESERSYIIDASKYGNLGTTKNGFGCSLRPIVIESVALRNISALKGFEAVNILKDFIGKYPEEAKSANLSLKNVLFSNATFYAIYSDMQQDNNVINYFCPENVTLGIYRQQLAKYTNLSEGYINNLTYDEALKIWRELEGID